MKASVKAALLSGFVFPGAGQFYLKQYWRGTIYECTTFSCNTDENNVVV